RDSAASPVRMRTLGIGTAHLLKSAVLNRSFSPTLMLNQGNCEERRLPARAGFEPIQIQDCSASVSQPSLNLSRLQRAIPRAKVAIEQFCNLLGRARPLNLVERPNNLFLELASRSWHLRHHR